MYPDQENATSSGKYQVLCNAVHIKHEVFLDFRTPKETFRGRKGMNSEE